MEVAINTITRRKYCMHVLEMKKCPSTLADKCNAVKHLCGNNPNI